MADFVLFDFITSGVSAAFSSLAGAVGGVLGSQWLTDRSKRRRELLEEINSINSAIAIAANIANTAFNAKMQHSKPMVDGLAAQRMAALTHHRLAPTTPFRVNADLNFIPPLRLPVESLVRVMLEKMLPPTRALSLAQAAVRASLDLDHFIEMRNELIIEFKSAGPIDPVTYLGLEVDGAIDARYRDFLSGTLSANDDCIYFCTELVQELTRYGERVRAKLSPRTREAAPQIVSVSFEAAKEWMPDRTKYESWNRMFLPFPEKPARPRFPIFRKKNRS